MFDASAKTSLLQTDQYFQMHNAQYAAMSDPNNIMQLFMQQQQQDADAQAHIANLICSVRRDHLGKYLSKICIKYMKHGSSSFSHTCSIVFSL